MFPGLVVCLDKHVVSYFPIQRAMNKYLLGMSIGTILVLISGVGVSTSAQPMNVTGSNKPTTSVSTCLTVCITYVQIMPTHPLVGLDVKVYANVTNNEKERISYMEGLGLGESPGIRATFDSHVTAEWIQGMACPVGLFIKRYINPGETVTLSGNPCGVEYKVVSGGTVRGIATFEYDRGIAEKAFSFSTSP
jgi:hypothetical protein